MKDNKEEILKSSIVVADKEAISCDLGGEAVILNLKSGIYYGLNPIGARVWNLIQESKTVKELLETLLEEYDVVVDRCEHDLLAVLQEMAQKRLIKVQNETTA